MPADVDTTNEAPATPRPALSRAWQAPALALSLLVLGGGIAAAVLTASKPRSDDLQRAAALLDAAAYGQALECLNSRVLPRVSGEGYSPDERRQFHLLRARALYLGQKEAALDRAENHDAIRREYEAAEALHVVLDPVDVFRLTETLVALGDLDAASRRITSLPATDRERTRALLRTIVERSIDAGEPGCARALDLIAAMASESGLTDEDRVWTLTRQAELLVAEGFAEEAVSKVVKALPRMEGVGAAAQGELRLALARAYTRLSDTREARAQLDIAARLLGSSHPLAPVVTLMLAETDHAEGELASARDRYVAVLERKDFARGQAPALLGLAEVEAKLEEREAREERTSFDRYEKLVGLIRTDADAVSRDRVGMSLLARSSERSDRGQFSQALAFAQLAEKLFEGQPPPSELLHALARAHARLAEELLTSTADDIVHPATGLDPAAQREARDHLQKAGGYFARHAERVVKEDAAAYALSLWSSADFFDRAGDLEACIVAFERFTSDLPGDKRRPEGLFRLALAHQARGGMEQAQSLYQRLIDERAGAEGSGEWGDRSVVPLARALLDDADAANDERAETLLVRAVSGEFGGPGSSVFRDAVLALGDRLLRTRRTEQAAERFEQYLALAGPDMDLGDLAPVQSRLADAYRLSASALAQTLDTAIPDGTRRSLDQQRRERLERALALYEKVRTAYEAEQGRGALEELTLRNVYFYKGDCAFDLGPYDPPRYDEAVRHYDAARERYPQHPATLLALTQVVAVRVMQGRHQEAREADERARRFYASLPETAWDDPTLPMSRADWERWLRSQDRLSGIGDGSDPEMPN